MQNLTIVETKSSKKTSISVKPYFDPTSENMGLEEYGLYFLME